VLTGLTPVFNRFAEKTISFLKKSFSVASMGAFLILILFFLPRYGLGVLSLLPNIVPNILILGAMGFFGIPIDLATAMVGAIAIGLIVDNTIHFLWRFREELEQSGDFDLSVKRSLVSSGQAIIMTSVILIGGFSVLTIGDFIPLTHVGQLLMLVIGCGLICDIVFLPALLFAVYKPLWERTVKNPIELNLNRDSANLAS